MMTTMTAEAFLTTAAELIERRILEPRGLKISTEYRVARGWPSKSALAAITRRVGEAWATDCSEDKVHEILISPCLARPDALATLVHELVHLAVGLKCGHRGPFKRAAKAVGLHGPAKATFAGPELAQQLDILAAECPSTYPGRLDTTKRREKKQGTRMLKLECPTCGYLVRTTAKWLEIGLPSCYCGERFLPEEP
jgi:hypothetical protein